MEDSCATTRSEQATTTSLKVAELFHKRHDHVLRDIERLLNKMEPTFGKTNFRRDIYFDSYGRVQKAYWMTENGFTLLTMGYSGKKATKPKVTLLEKGEG